MRNPIFGQVIDRVGKIVDFGLRVGILGSRLHVPTLFPGSITLPWGNFGMLSSLNIWPSLR